MKKSYVLFSAAASLLFFSCSEDPGFQDIVTIYSVEEHQDVRWKDLSNLESELDSNFIKTLKFNEKTVWPDSYDSFAKSLIERGKNPGLGVASLHKQGITGKGITMAIIDQNLCLDNPEFGHKILEYKDVGCNTPGDESSMHGPAVASLLVSDDIGTAPDAQIYYVAAPSWTSDAQYQADALLWIIEKNKTLPEGEKIRAVSVSAAPSGEGSPFDKHNAAWDEAVALAQQSGILVIDCTTDNGFTASCYYDISYPDDITKVTTGYPGTDYPPNTERLYVPTSRRTVAEQYSKGNYSYYYCGVGGLSWAEPYVAGVLAMGWQLKPEISNETMVELLKKSSYKDAENAMIINPVAFIDSVKAFTSNQ